MNELNDDQLVELCKQGEPHAFEQLIIKYHKPLFNYILSLSNDKGFAEDMVQEVFIRMINNIDKYKYKAGAKFSTWLFTIARNKVVDEFRKKSGKDFVYIDEDSNFALESKDDIENIIIQKSNIDDIQKVLDSLPQESKTVIYLRYYMGFSYKEISKILSYSPEKVKWRLNDTLEKLRKLLKTREVKTNGT